jgi:hypothetical protein
MASIGSVLGDIGKGLKKFFGVAVVVAVDAEPFVDTVFPGAAVFFNAAANAAAKAEGLAAAAGAQSGTGAQKLALVVASLETSVAEYEAASGLKTPMTQAQIESAVNGVVAFLNALPASS